MADDVDRQQMIEESARRRSRGEEDVMVRVQLRRIVVVKRVHCPKKDNRPVVLDKCRLCKDNVGVRSDGEMVHCKFVTQRGRSVEVRE